MIVGLVMVQKVEFRAVDGQLVDEWYRVEDIPETGDYVIIGGHTRQVYGRTWDGKDQLIIAV